MARVLRYTVDAARDRYVLGCRLAKDAFVLRPVTISDANTIARHRAAMFTEMGTLPAALHDGLVTANIAYLHHAIPAGEYVGWFAAPAHDPGTIAAGAGILLRRVPPHPRDGMDGVMLAEGRQGVIVNVYTEKAWRRRGLAKRLLEEAIAWAGKNNLESLILHASPAGRPLYEQLGFMPANEMRYPSRLLHERSLRESPS